jgi:hypothetical protein
VGDGGWFCPEAGNAGRSSTLDRRQLAVGVCSVLEFFIAQEQPYARGIGGRRWWRTPSVTLLLINVGKTCNKKCVHTGHNMQRVFCLL